jgi:hypothetical protein
MLEKKDLTIEELRSRLNRAIVADEGANVSCDQVKQNFLIILVSLMNTQISKKNRRNRNGILLVNEILKGRY